MSTREHTGRRCPQLHQQILTEPLPCRCQLALGDLMMNRAPSLSKMLGLLEGPDKRLRGKVEDLCFGPAHPLLCRKPTAFLEEATEGGVNLLEELNSEQNLIQTGKCRE